MWANPLPIHSQTHEKSTIGASPRTRQEAARRGRRETPSGQHSSVAALAPARRSADPCGRTRSQSISRPMRSPLSERPPGRVKKPPGYGVRNSCACMAREWTPRHPPDNYSRLVALRENHAAEQHLSHAGPNWGTASYQIIRHGRQEAVCKQTSRRIIPCH